MMLYEGLFFTGEMAKLIHSLEQPMLININDELHCTFKYRPQKDEIFNDIIGKSFEVYLVGYANDGKNSGFEITLPNTLEKYYINYDEKQNKLKMPHITASLADGSKAVDTCNLKFIPLEKPIKIAGKFGLWVKENNTEYLSFISVKHDD